MEKDYLCLRYNKKRQYLDYEIQNNLYGDSILSLALRFLRRR